MVWLLSGLLVVVGLVVLGVIAVGLVGRLRGGRASLTALRARLAEGSGRLRVELGRLRRWLRNRHGSRHSIA